MNSRSCIAVFLAVVVLLIGAGQIFEPAAAQNAPEVLGTKAQTDFWRAIREGQAGTVAGQDKLGGTLIQSEGDTWRAFRNGPLSHYSAQFLLITILVLAIFFLLRGRIAVDKGWAGKLIERFNSLERFGHWLLAVSFIILALSGLNLLFGRYVLAPVIGPEAFGTITAWGKIAHNYVAFAFMAGLVLVFLAWIKDNIPSFSDLKWFAKGGGIFGDEHPPAKRFNGGQKIIFWIVIIAGVSISLSGFSLLFPFEYPMFAKTFEIMNKFGFNFSTDLTPIQEMQYAQIWHTIVAVFMIVVIFAHIYIGTIGMQGAFSAMGSGKVDLNWAKQHHSLWVEKLEREGKLDMVNDPDHAPARNHGAGAGATSGRPQSLSSAATPLRNLSEDPGYEGWQKPYADSSGTSAPPPRDRIRAASGGAATDRLADLAQRAAAAPLAAGAAAVASSEAASAKPEPKPEPVEKPVAKKAEAPKPAAKKPAAKKTAAKKASTKKAPAKKKDDGTPKRPKGLKAARRGKADELQRISGVGPKLENTLHGLGFFHFDQIANWSRGEVNWVDDHLRFKGRIDRDEWIKQAKLLAAGDEKKFARLYGTGGMKDKKTGQTKSGTRTRKA